jgi:hypothetical protein
MADFYAETIKLLGSGVVGALCGYVLKEIEIRNQDRRKKDDLWSTQIQNHWLPLLEAARELNSRFDELSRVYRKEWTNPFNPDDLSGDFRELYSLNRDKNWSQRDPNAPRKDGDAVQRVRTRMSHELNYAASSLYITAKYLGIAEQVQRNLRENLLIVSGDARNEMIRVISNVRGSLQGRAGIFREQQESIAEIVWGPAGRVITNFEFRKRLLDLPGWEQFTNLFRFFVDFEPKVKYEVADTISSLLELEREVNQLSSCPSKKAYEALWRRRLRAGKNGDRLTKDHSG